MVNAGLLLVGLRRRGIYRPQPGWGGFGWRLAVALGALALLLALVVPRFDWVALREQPLLRIALALGLVGTGAAVYLGVLVALGLRPRQFVRRTGDPS